mmetsp:Transcript_24659/g.62423  ORF Transcript_24659/g.62423 Transcript_24659/m.62423 type:complete len:321 (+) Transcript_24659:1078-2040(+)
MRSPDAALVSTLYSASCSKGGLPSPVRVSVTGTPTGRSEVPLYATRRPPARTETAKPGSDARTQHPEQAGPRRQSQAARHPEARSRSPRRLLAAPVSSFSPVVSTAMDPKGGTRVAGVRESTRSEGSRAAYSLREMERASRALGTMSVPRIPTLSSTSSLRAVRVRSSYSPLYPDAWALRTPKTVIDTLKPSATSPPTPSRLTRTTLPWANVENPPSRARRVPASAPSRESVVTERLEGSATAPGGRRMSISPSEGMGTDGVKTTEMDVSFPARGESGTMRGGSQKGGHAPSKEPATTAPGIPTPRSSSMGAPPRRRVRT